jgi:flagellar motor switch protein FliG
MKINLTKMQKKIDNLMSVFTNIVDELNTQISELGNAISANRELILTAELENDEYQEKINDYEALRNKVESIIK